jgi:predicted esterase YcpF (UPF0227 family)
MIIYLHGFRSSPQSVKARQFAQAIAALPAAVRPRFEVPALPPDPPAAVALVAGLIERKGDPETNVTLVGSSLGGYYATHLAEAHGVRAALINPAIRPYDDLAAYVGWQRNLYTGEAFEVTPAHFVALRTLKVARITRPDRYFLLLRSGDEVLEWREAATFYGGAWQYVCGGGDHGWADFAEEIPSILRFARVAATPLH